MTRTFFLIVLFILNVEILQAFELNDSIQAEILYSTNVQNVKKDSKLELAISLPEGVNQQINTFIKTSSKGINPFLSWEIRTYAVFKHAKIPDSIVIDAFYTREYKAFMKDPLPIPRNKIDYDDEEYKRIGGYIPIETEKPFRVRFLPQQSGEWTYYVAFETENIKQCSRNYTVYVEDALGNDYLKISPTKRFLQQNEKPFIPLGMNASWAATYRDFDPELFEYHTFKVDGVEYYKPEYYRKATVVPRVYWKYREVLNSFALNGVNYFRTIMAPISSEIEWEELGNYSKRLHLAQELDSVVYLAEKNNMLIHWDLAIHYTFNYNVYYINYWDWEDSDGTPSYAYKKKFHLKDPIDFFKHEESKLYYKERLRYIISRWGYSTSIGMFELFSEINNIGKHDSNGNYPYAKDYKVIEEWQKEMAAYIKSHYFGKLHLLTSSYAGKMDPNDLTYFQNENFDVMSSNMYDFGAPNFSQFFTSRVSETMLNENPKKFSNSTYTKKCKIKNFKQDCEYDIKPLIFSESDPIDVIGMENKNVVEMNRHIAQGVFSGLALSLSWSNWHFTENYSVYGQLKTFLSNHLISDEWHPGASALLKNDSLKRWVFNPDYESKMINNFGKVDLSYLRSNDKTAAIGVLTNKTYNVYTTDEQFTPPSDFSWKLRKQRDVRLQKEKVFLRGLEAGNYLIEYFYLHSPNQAFHQQVINHKTKRFDVTIPATKEGYIVLFCVKKME
jgi:hypothetical protein